MMTENNKDIVICTEKVDGYKVKEDTCEKKLSTNTFVL